MTVEGNHQLYVESFIHGTAERGKSW